LAFFWGGSILWGFTFVHNDVMLAFGTPEKEINLNQDPYLPNRFNLLMVKLNIGSMSFYLKQGAFNAVK